jgi:hypothetical protein
VSDNFFDKLKDTLSKGATQSAHMVEEAAKTGKIHLDIINEKRRLSTQFEELGKFLFKQIENSEEDLEGEDPELIKKIGEIKMVKDELAKLRGQLDPGEKVDEEDEDFKSGV